MTRPAWIDTALIEARPRAMGALVRYFRDLDAAEEAFQEACLRALKSWPETGAPRDPAAWLIMSGRNAALDELRRRKWQEALPVDEPLAAPASETENALAERVANGQYRDDVLRLLFICCHPDLAPQQQIGLALRVVSGLSVREIARAFLVTETAMEQRITRAKRQIAASGVPFETPGTEERQNRLAVVASMIYLLFNEGYSASSGDVHVRVPLCMEAIRLSRLLADLFPEQAEIKGLTALLLLQHSRTAARLDRDGQIVLLEDQDRLLWNREMIDEGVRLLRDALSLKQPGPYQVQAAIAAVHSQAAEARLTDWAEIDRLYRALEVLQPSPVITLNRSVAIAKIRGPAAALAMIEPLEEALNGYFSYFGVKGAMLARLGRVDEAQTAFRRAIVLAHTPAEADHIRLQLQKLNFSHQPV